MGGVMVDGAGRNTVVTVRRVAALVVVVVGREVGAVVVSAADVVAHTCNNKFEHVQ